MRPYTIEFVAQESITTMVPMLDAFKFKPKSRAQWLQRLAWRSGDAMTPNAQAKWVGAVAASGLGAELGGTEQSK